MSQTTPACDLKLGYVPTVFMVGRRQNIVVYSRCQGIAEWHVAGTDDWQSDASKTPDRDGYYQYRLRPKWHQAITDAAGIRCHFRPLPVEAHEPITLTLDLIVEDTQYAQLAHSGTLSPNLLAPRVLTFALWAATALLGLWAIAAIITDLAPALFQAFTGQMGATDRRRLFDIFVNVWLILLGFVWIGVVIVGGEYHRKRIGQPNSWKVLGVTLTVEGAILVASLLT
jgi:hypothetical protein